MASESNDLTRKAGKTMYLTLVVAFVLSCFWARASRDG